MLVGVYSSLMHCLEMCVHVLDLLTVLIKEGGWTRSFLQPYLVLGEIKFV